MFTLDLTGEGN
uniref:Uncharacterized protein n=1 Tax=Rhizophora mucronata TaxID=61149 RepID=A0A2P2QGE9_RHIMU